MTTRAAQTAREADPLVYAFSAEGSLDPGTKLLDVGLDRYTPIGALRTLVKEPLHMSVAIHEMTHFVSLENALGHVMGFLAMRAKTIASGIADQCQRGVPVDASSITAYAEWHRKFRVLLELWRPLLEGLAVFAQTHVPDDEGDALMEPLELLATWYVVVHTLAVSPTVPLEAFLDDILPAAYRAIRRGPQLPCGELTLAGGFELVRDEALRPYFLGHAYLRALQAELARGCPRYAKGEVFFNLMIRILRSSTRGLLADCAHWDHPSMARRVYGWLDTARQAPAARVAALPTQPDAVDVLHFLATGETRLGYDGTLVADIAALDELVPEFWRAFVSERTQRQADNVKARPDDVRSSLSPIESAQRLAGHWMRGCMSLNLSSDGAARVIGWIPEGVAPLHALALQVDDAQWLLAASDDDLALIVENVAELPKLTPHALLHACAVPPTLCRVSIDCFVVYAPASLPEGKPVRMPKLHFVLGNGADSGRSLLTEIAPRREGIVRTHLRVLAGGPDSELHRATTQMRRIVRDAPAHGALANQLQAQGQATIAQALRDAVASEERAASRVQAQVERQILAGLLQREPAGADLDLLTKGVGAVPGAAAFEPLIATSYGRLEAVDAATAERVRELNDRSLDAIGIALFDIRPDNGAVNYRGLAGAHKSNPPNHPKGKTP